MLKYLLSMNILSTYQVLAHTYKAQGKIINTWEGTILSNIGFDSHVDRKK